MNTRSNHPKQAFKRLTNGKMSILSSNCFDMSIFNKKVRFEQPLKNRESKSNLIYNIDNEETNSDERKYISTNIV